MTLNVVSTVLAWWADPSAGFIFVLANVGVLVQQLRVASAAWLDTDCTRFVTFALSGCLKMSLTET